VEAPTVNPKCLLCDSPKTGHFLDSRDHVTGETFGLQKCDDCGFVFTWPQPADLSRYYGPFYRQYSSGSAGILQKLQQRRTRAWTRALGKPGRCLEIGCGNGWILAALRDQGWRGVGAERTADSARFARHQLGLPMFVGPLDAVRHGADFDLIVLHQVLEHLPDPMATLRHCARLLRPGGTLIVAVPNLASWQFRFAREHWLHLDVPRHLGHFTPACLRSALATVNLEVVHENYVSWEYDPFGWVESVLNKMGFPMNSLLRILQHDPSLRKRPVTMGCALTVAGLLAIPTALMATASWIFHRGAIMELRARKCPAGSAVSE